MHQLIQPGDLGGRSRIRSQKNCNGIESEVLFCNNGAVTCLFRLGDADSEVNEEAERGI